MKTMIHVITGPPCSGKSTYCVQNAKDGDMVIDYDKIAEALGSRTSHAAEGHIRQAAFEAREGAIKTALKMPDAETWVIHTTPNEEHMKSYEEAEAEIIELDPGYDVCIERAKRDGRPQQTFDGIEKWYSGEKGKKMEKTYKPFEAKADAGTGQISGYFSTYDRIPDTDGDIIAPGAFTDTIKAREESGHPFPLCWGHDLNMIIGKVDSIKDTEKGPLMTASFFNTPLAQEKREIVKSGVVYQFSYAYDVRKSGNVTLEDGTRVRELRKLDLHEVSIVPIPANINAVVTDIKSGKRNRKSDEETIQQIITPAQSRLDEGEDKPDGEDTPEANAAAEEQKAGNPKKTKLLEFITEMEGGKMAPKEELKKLEALLAALKGRIEADDAEAIAEGEKLQAKIEAKRAEVERAEKKAALLGAIGTREKEDEMPEKKAARTLGENFVEQVKSANVGKKFSVLAPAFVKAADSIQVTPAVEGVDAYATTFDRNVITEPRTALVIRDLFGAETISGSTLVYLVEGAIEGAPGLTGEAAEKKQVHFADPTPKTVTLEKLTCYIKESDEYISDYPFLASAINGRLLYHLGLVEQNKLVADLVGTGSIQTDTTSWAAVSDTSELADLILKAALDVQDESGFAADAIVLNPATWYTLRVAKNGDKDYYGGGFFGAQNVPNLWGIPVCVTTAVTASQIIVGAFKTCGSVVSKGGISVEATNTDQDDFIKNLMTIRAEERLALAVRRPAGFKLLTK